MLGFTANENASMRTGPTLGDPRPVVLPERRLVVITDGVERPAHAPARRPSQDQRRTVGIGLLVLTFALDAVAILFWLRGILIGTAGRSPRFFGLVYVGIALLLLLPTYRRGRVVTRPSEMVIQIATRVAAAPVLTAMIAVAMNKHLLDNFNMIVYAALVGTTVTSVLLGRLVVFRVSQLARARGYDLEDTLIVGAGPVGVKVAEALEGNSEFGLVPFGFLDRFDDDLPYPTVGKPEDLAGVLVDTHIRHVVLAFGSASEEEIVSYVRQCSNTPVQFYAVPRFFELGVARGTVGHEVDGFALVPLRQPGHTHNMWPAKRAFDLCVSGLLLVLTAPVMALCAIAVKLSSPGPVFFRQMRVGVDNRPFEILKFRSMRVNDDSETKWAVDGDDRITRIGGVLRKSHLDELPQIINVLKGEMSIVGPRPERPYFVEQFSGEIDGYEHRHRVPSGITGWAQVNGFWGDTSIEARTRLDNRYIENWSLWRDLVIALRTIPTFLGKRR